MPISIKTVILQVFYRKNSLSVSKSKYIFTQILQKLLKVFNGFVGNFAKFAKKYKKIYKNPLTNNSFWHNM